MARSTGRYRSFGGKRFWKYRADMNKRDATSKGKELKASGKYLVRVVKEGDGYSIYCKEK